MNVRRLLLMLAVLGLAPAAGCSNQPPRELPPAIDAAAAGQAAIDQYDTNHDGAISGTELDPCPPLKSALARFDGGGDGRVTAATIAARIKQWQETQAGSMGVNIIVQLDGQPLEGAAVSFEPEKFLGPNLTAAGEPSDAHGFTAIRRQDRPGVPLGLYRIRVSKIVGGKETIPPRYNAQTTLGMEVAIITPPPGVVIFNLTSK